jgi:hypothetical protein
MNLRLGLSFCLIIASSMLAASPAISAAQTTGATQESIAVQTGLGAGQLPEAPLPQIDTAQLPQDTAQLQQIDTAETEVRPTSTGGQTDAQKSDHDKAADQIKAQEQQRVLGVVPTFNITYLGDATVSMTAKQKFGLVLRSQVDPISFATPFFIAGYDEIFNDNKHFGWGVEGFAKRTGAAYLDSFNGAMIGNAILPSILHQDPRYYRMGHGSVKRRFLYAVATSVICKHDNTGKWEPNYSNVLGNISAGAISTLYYPQSNSSAGLAISNGLVVTAEGAIGAVFDEFWPDLSRRWLHKDPSHGIDARLKEEDQARKNPANVVR